MPENNPTPNTTAAQATTAPIKPLVSPVAAAQATETTAPVQATETATSEASQEKTLLDTVATESKKWANKYESPEALEKGYLEAQKKLSERTPAPPDDYKLDTIVAEVFKDSGFGPAQNAEVYAQYNAALKDANVTAEQLPKLLAIYKNDMMAQTQKINELSKAQQPKADIASEKAKLEQIWGSQTDTNLTALKQFSQNLPKDVVRSLNQTAEGAQFLFDIMKSKAGPIPMRENPISAPDPREIQQQIKDIINSKEYRDITHPDHQAINRKIEGLFKIQQQSRSA